MDYQAQVSSYAHMRLLTPSQALTTLVEPDGHVHYLEFYYHCVGPMLSGRFDTEFWSRTILQMAHADPGVRCALIALAHLNQQENGSLQHARQTAAKEGKPERRLFWSNYNKAIGHLVDQMAQPAFSAEVGLVICLLFACIEFLQAEPHTAFTHIRSGLNIVAELRQQNKTGSLTQAVEPRQVRISGQSNMIEQTLVPILTQALASALPYGASLEKDFTFLESCPQYFQGHAFTSLIDARSSFFDLRNAAILLARDMAVKLYGLTPVTPADHRRRDLILERHLIWLQALQAFEGSQELSKRDTLAISALKLGYCSSFTACSCIDDKTQLSFDAHLANFQALVRHARDLTNSLDLDRRRRPSRASNAAANFTFDTSFIPALFYTAIRCRCPTTRRQAVSLLALDLPREGLWDPEQHRIVAERVIEIEEMDVDANGWPTEASRLCMSSVGTDVDEYNGFQANFLYTKDLAMAATKTWCERLTLGEGGKESLSLHPKQTTTPIMQ
jgi:hypothetical protein